MRVSKSSELYFEGTGILFGMGEGNSARVWEIFSLTGGAGATSDEAVMTARMLAMEEAKDGSISISKEKMITPSMRERIFQAYRPKENFYTN